jgi:flavin-dependent dehydrogenase
MKGAQRSRSTDADVQTLVRFISEGSIYMPRLSLSILFILSFCMPINGFALRNAAIIESAREIPLAYDVDVIVVGGTTRGVAAAVAAANAGAKVFLCTDRPYLGEDMCATYRLWLEDGETPESGLAKSIFLGEPDTNTVTTAPLVRMPTPMTVKIALDTALLDAGVTFLYGSYMADVLHDSKGRFAGITIVNRSGRQAIRGKVIIDATERAMAARICGAEFMPYPAGKQSFKRIVIGGDPGDAATMLDREITLPTRALPVYEYTLELDMPDGSWDSFVRAETEARQLTWQDSQAAASEKLYQVPPDPLKARKTWLGKWEGADSLDVDALRPGGIDSLYVLGGCAAVSRETAAAIMRPLAGTDLGARVGKMAAKEADAQIIGPVSEMYVRGQIDPDARHAEIGERLNGSRSTPPLKVGAMISSPQRSIPVIGRYDTVVVGGGTGGASAGIGAARGGSRTLVIEYLYGLGGVGTIGRIAKYYHGNRVGFTAEIDAGVASFKPDSHKRRGWSIENKMEWLRREIVNAGGDVWFRTLGAGAIMEGDRCIGVIVATPAGRGAVLANTVIDSTGNSVIPACAGMETQAIRGEHISVQGTGMPQQTPGDGYWNSDWTFVDDDDVLDMWRVMVVGKQKYKNAFDLGQLIDTRARRRIVGDIVISPMDIMNKRTYPDIITVAKSNFDNHGFSSHDLFMVSAPDTKGLTGNVPYRALMPKGKDGLLVTGLGMSAHGDAMPVMRMQADVQNQGYAAGKASAMAAENGTTVRKIDVKALQRHLVDVGIIPESFLSVEDSYPLSDDAMQVAVKQIGTNYGGIAVVLSDTKRASPHLRNAYLSATDEAQKLRYAHVLGMLFDDTGTASLIKAVTAGAWDKGWNFRGLGQYGATTSYMDNLVIALGRTRDTRGLPAVLVKLKALTPESEFSHCRAVAMALETFMDPRAAKPLSDFLQQPGISGHSFLEIRDVIERTPVKPTRSDTSTRNHSLRELILARALYRCGDQKGVGEAILKNYAIDYRGHYARHAKSVLQGDDG